MPPQPPDYVSLNDGKLYRTHHAKQYILNAISCWKELVIVGLCITVGLLTFPNPLQGFSSSHEAAIAPYNLTSEQIRWRQFHWHTGTYSTSSHSAEDEARLDETWNAIVPAHGFVAVDHDWATEHGLPASMNLPSDASKGVYIIDAYHQIHCLTIIRKTMTELSHGKPLSVPIEHSRHCFDSLLQYVVCGTSGDTLLYTWGRNETGDGQLRRCVDWRSRSEWAKRNSACYADADHPIPLNDHFGHCETRDGDGIQGMWW